MHLKTKIADHFILLLVFILFVAFVGCLSNKELKGVKELIIIQSSIGDITIELYSDKAPLTVANFMQYIDNNAFIEATFYRTTRPGNDPSISVLQGGLWRPWEKGMVMEYKSAFPSISHESTKISGIKHKDGVISMGRFETGTANSEFFICIGDNPSLDFGGDRNKDGQGFAAFGRVIKGMDIVRSIHALPTEVGEGYKGQILVEPVKITNMIRAKI